MVSFFDIVDGTVVHDAYSTPVRWSRVMLVHTARISWCCLFSYFISEPRRDGLWACPQLSSYSWWGCEYNICTIVDKLYFQLLGEVYVCELYYWPARVFSRAPPRCSSFNLSLGSLTWLTYAYGMHCQDDVPPIEFLIIQCACQFFWTRHFNSCMCMINCWSLYLQAAW